MAGLKHPPVEKAGPHAFRRRQLRHEGLPRRVADAAAADAPVHPQREVPTARETEMFREKMFSET
jgi:hypothetical protein